MSKAARAPRPKPRAKPLPIRPWFERVAARARAYGGADLKLTGWHAAAVLVAFFLARQLAVSANNRVTEAYCGDAPAADPALTWWIADCMDKPGSGWAFVAEAGVELVTLAVSVALLWRRVPNPVRHGALVTFAALWVSGWFASWPAIEDYGGTALERAEAWLWVGNMVVGFGGLALVCGALADARQAGRLLAISLIVPALLLILTPLFL